MSEQLKLTARTFCAACLRSMLVQIFVQSRREAEIKLHPLQQVRVSLSLARSLARARALSLSLSVQRPTDSRFILSPPPCPLSDPSPSHPLSSVRPTLRRSSTVKKRRNACARSTSRRSARATSPFSCLLGYGSDQMHVRIVDRTVLRTLKPSL
jgi:hypothetical protein